jgi:acylpyruvate hydrolase
MILKVNDLEYEAQRVFCIAKNYISHVNEFKDKPPPFPTFFLKPNTSLVPPGRKVPFPTHGSNLHHEVEVVILVGRDGKLKSKNESKSFISGISIGLDLTLRDIQSRLKEGGLPWEISKAFDNSAPLGNFISYTTEIDLKNIDFSCQVNSELRQKGNTGQMIFDIETLIWEINKIWTYQAGDLIFTGTPAGVGSLNPTDVVEISSEPIGRFVWEII